MEKLNDYFARVRKHVENEFSEYIPKLVTPSRKITDAMFYSLMAGGKRVRPVLAFLTAEMCGEKWEKVTPFACAIEMVHTYSLIHDDLPAVDNDDFRRGKPTSHKMFGEAMAILAGDALLTHAFHVLAETAEYISGNTILKKVIQEFSLACGYAGMIAGQVADMIFEGKNCTPEELFYIHENKTGKIITASLTIPAMICGQPDERLELFRTLGESTGMLFQITDDLLDVTGTAVKLGKTPGKDAASKKNTWVTLFGVDEARKKAEEIYKECLEILGKLGGNPVFSELIDFIYRRDY